MGGKREPDGTFSSGDYYGTFWTSDEYNRTVSVHFDQIYSSHSQWDPTSNGFSVRCVKDDTAYVSYGNRLDVSAYGVGEYDFLVTSTYEGCESFPETVHLTMKASPPPPVVPDVEACLGTSGLAMTATGENITWYHDPETDRFVDERNGREYGMVVLGNQVWMAENLDVGIRINGAAESADNGIIETYHYNNDPSLGAQYGGLYQWDEMMAYTLEENTRGVCPEGWVLPSNADWMELEIALGMTQAEATLYGFRGTDQGTRLKDGGSSGFDVLMGGKRTEEGTYASLGDYATFWNSSGYNRTFSRTSSQIFASRSTYDAKNNGFSVRCLLEESLYTTRGSSLPVNEEQAGTYHFSATQTWDGCESPRAEAMLLLTETPEPPLPSDYEFCENEVLPDLQVEGEGIHWYADAELTDLLHVGNSFHPSSMETGENLLYVTRHHGQCESSAAVVSVRMIPVPGAPVASDAACCAGDPVPDLVAEGTNVIWWTDAGLTGQVWDGAVFPTGQTEPGTYTYHATAMADGCRSQGVPVSLRIHPMPDAPRVELVSVCDGEPVPALQATGSNLTWYGDAGCTQWLADGPAYETGASEPGSYRFHVTEKNDFCESEPGEAGLDILPVPDIELGKDTVITRGMTVVFGPFPQDYQYLWNDGSTSSYLVFDSHDLDPGTYLIRVVAGLAGCETADSLTLTVQSPIGFPGRSIREVQLYPNPVHTELTIVAAGDLDGLVELRTLGGNLMHAEPWQERVQRIDMSRWEPGVYLLVLRTREGQLVCKVVKM
ncbi:MAG: FISUMP domain-containing protein [Bacteroidales bacterium]